MDMVAEHFHYRSAAFRRIDAEDSMEEQQAAIPRQAKIRVFPCVFAWPTFPEKHAPCKRASPAFFCSVSFSAQERSEGAQPRGFHVPSELQTGSVAV